MSGRAAGMKRKKEEEEEEGAVAEDNGDEEEEEEDEGGEEGIGEVNETLPGAAVDKNAAAAAAMDVDEDRGDEAANNNSKSLDGEDEQEDDDDDDNGKQPEPPTAKTEEDGKGTDGADGEKKSEAEGISLSKNEMVAKGASESESESASGSCGSDAPSGTHSPIFTLYKNLNSAEEGVVTEALTELSDILAGVKNDQEELEKTCALVWTHGGTLALAMSFNLSRFDSEDTQEICVRAVDNLSTCSLPFCKGAMAKESGLLDRIVDTLKAYPKHKEIPNYVFAALSSFSEHKANAVYIVEQLKIVPFITNAMKKFKNDTEIQADASCLLNTLLCFAETKNTLKEFDADRKITSLLKVAMKTHTDENAEFVVELHKDAKEAVEKLNEDKEQNKAKKTKKKAMKPAKKSEKKKKAMKPGTAK